MRVICKWCGNAIVVPNEIKAGQRIRCPFCENKFEFSIEYTAIEEVRETDIRKAVEICLSDAKTTVEWGQAPEGARRYLRLEYYGKVFGRRIDRTAYLNQFDIVIPTLDEQDLSFLIGRETDLRLRNYFKDLLAALQATDNKDVHRQLLSRQRPNRVIMRTLPPNFKRRGVDNNACRNGDEGRKSNEWIRDVIARVMLSLCVIGVAFAIYRMVCKLPNFNVDRSDELQTLKTIEENSHRLCSELQEEKRTLESKVSNLEKTVTQKEVDAKTKEEALKRDYEERVEKLREKYESELLSKRVIEDHEDERCVARESDVTKSESSNVRECAPIKDKDGLPVKQIDVKAELKSVEAAIRTYERKLSDLRMMNPACLFNTDPRTIRNREIKLLGREDKRYYKCANKTYVRPLFYCTYCKCEVEDEEHRCQGSKVSFPLWRAAKRNVQVTLETNQKIDQLIDELETLKEKQKALKQRR